MAGKSEIEALVQDTEVVLFMKGTRARPQCGFSASVVDILDEYLDDYTTVDVLADAELREAIKAFSEWPTLPQLYVRGKFVGGADIVKELQAAGELGAALGASARPLRTPEITVTEGAIRAFAQFWDGAGKPSVRLEVDREFRAGLAFDPPKDKDVVLDDERFALVMDRRTAERADGVVIDWVDTPEGGGFRIENPNAPPAVRSLSAAQLAAWLTSGKPLELFDVRTDEEREVASIAPSTLLDGEGKQRLAALSRDTPVAFYCHHGVRSLAAAEHCLRMGFREVYNVTGGIDAWSREVDSSVPRY